MKQSIQIDTLQWFLGIYIAIRGTLMLMLPHTLDTHAFVPIQAQLSWLGVWQVVAGATLITAIALLPRRPLVLVAHFMVAFVFIQAARGHLLADSWTASVGFSVLGIGLAIAPLLPRSWNRAIPREIDLFALVMAIRSLLDGLLALAPFNPQFDAPFYDPIRPYLLWYGGGYLVGGLALLIAYLCPPRRPWFFRSAHLLAGGVMWVWIIGLGMPTWNSVLYYGGLGSLLILLPWIAPRIRQIDPGSLQTQLAVTLVGVVVLPLLVAVSLITAPQERAVVQQALMLQQTLAKALSQDIASYVGLHRAAIQAIAQQPDIANLLPTEQQNLLRRMHQNYRDFVVLATYDANGTAIARSDTRPLGPMIADRPAFQRAQETGESTFSIRVGRVIGKPVFVFLSPVYDNSEAFSGVVIGAIEASQVAKHLLETSGIADISAYLVDEKGRVIAHPKIALVNEFVDYSHLPPVAESLQQTTRFGGMHYWDSAAWQLAGYAQVPELGWSVVVERPAADVLLALNNRRDRDFILLLIIATTTLIIGLVVARRLTEPLSTLAYATEQLALGGDRQAPLPYSRISEVAHLSHTFGMMRDRLIARTAERDQAATELRQSEAKIRRLVESNIIGVILADLNGFVLEANDAFLQIIGYTREDLEHQRIQWKAMTPPEFKEVSLNSIHELKTQGFCTPFEKEYIRKDGNRVSVLIGSALVEEQSTQVIGFVLDLTDRKQMEREREQLLARERLAREQAESANRIKDEFLAVLSHELRSPLNPILGWTKLLQQGKLDEPASRRALSIIERNAKLQTQLIDDLLDVSRILRGKMKLNIYPTSIVTVVESALETVRLAAEAKQIQITLSVSLEQQQVLGDSTRLQQIVWNLLSNAIKFTPDGGQVEVILNQVECSHNEQGRQRTASSLPLHSYVQLVVKDTGKGIRPDFLPHVFDYFRQEDGTTTRKFGGLGLGLAIVRHLTELHGGTVDADSAGEGQGAAFTVRLPLSVTPRQSELASTPDPTFDFCQLHILVVDDEEDMRFLAQTILEQQGATVIVAASAHEALNLLERQPVDVLISDIGMPEMNGYQLMEQLRSRPPEQGRDVVAIALTAYAGEYDRQQAIEVGFQKHISKPVEPETLVNAIAELITQ